MITTDVKGVTEFRPDKIPLVSGIANAAMHKYRYYKGEYHEWLVGDIPNCASQIYVKGCKDSNGFNGQTLKFELVDGTILEWKGPWHSNSDSFFRDTGVDIRDKHYTFGCVAVGRKYEGWEVVFRGILHIDKEPTLGTYNRIETLANNYTTELGIPLYYYSRSEGGSTSGNVGTKK